MSENAKKSLNFTEKITFPSIFLEKKHISKYYFSRYLVLGKAFTYILMGNKKIHDKKVRKVVF